MRNWIEFGVLGICVIDLLVLLKMIKSDRYTTTQKMFLTALVLVVPFFGALIVYFMPKPNLKIFAFVALLSVFPWGWVHAEDVPHVRNYAKEVVHQLASKSYWGREYTKHGMEKAQKFLELEIRKIGLTPLDGKSFLQPFSYPVQPFPGKMDVRLNGQTLIPGVDFIVSPGAPGGVQTGDLAPSSGSTTEFTDPSGKVVVSLLDKLTWSVSQSVDSMTKISVDRAKFKKTPTRFEFKIETKFVPAFHANNLAAVVRGTAQPDRYFIFTAHYDHLGGMGAKAYFPGANDNASGVSLLLSLAKYYAVHPQPYSIGFIFFAGEEGAMIVNATEFPTEFSTLKKINDEGHYLVQIGSRGKAPNSDHYWFTEHGVPAFFMYTMGGIKAYHDVFDRSETLPMNKIDDVFALTLKFGQSIAGEATGT